MKMTDEDEDENEELENDELWRRHKGDESKSRRDYEAALRRLKMMKKLIR